jgi:hypothetical protein
MHAQHGRYDAWGGHVRRREFLGALGSAATVWPRHAQQPEQMRRIGFLRVGPSPETFISGFRRGLRELGLLEGQHFVSNTAWRRVRRKSLMLQWSWRVAE